MAVRRRRPSHLPPPRQKTFFNYARNTWEGNDGKPSIKRILGIILILSGAVVCFYGVFKCSDNLGDVALIAGTLIGGGLALFGITSWQTNSQDRIYGKRDYYD